MPLLKGGPKRWKWTEIILKIDKLIVNVVVFKLCNCIWVFLKSKGEKKIGGITYWLTLVITDAHERINEILTAPIYYLEIL